MTLRAWSNIHQVTKEIWHNLISSEEKFLTHTVGDLRPPYLRYLNFLNYIYVLQIFFHTVRSSWSCWLFYAIFSNKLTKLTIFLNISQSCTCHLVKTFVYPVFREAHLWLTFMLWLRVTGTCTSTQECTFPWKPLPALSQYTDQLLVVYV